MILLSVISLLALTTFMAWRYSKTAVDPDLGMYLLPAFTGAAYGRDFVDCKTPGVHTWHWLLSKLVGRNVERVKFANHWLVGIVGILLYFLTGSFTIALVYTVMVNSGFLFAFHGNVGQVPAALFAIAIALPHQPIWAILLGLIAVGYEPKLLPSLVILAAVSGWWGFFYTIVPLGVITLVLWNKLRYRNKWLWDIWESSITIPIRMQKARVHPEVPWPWMPWFQSQVFVYILPWLILAIVARPDPLYWLPALAYIVVLMLGYTIRANHLIPLVAWIAMANISPWLVFVLASVDWMAGGFYLGDIWVRFYYEIRMMNLEAKVIGEWLKDQVGDLWVSGINTSVYVYAQKPPVCRMVDQIEIRAVAKERIEQFVRLWRAHSPEWVVASYNPGIKFTGAGYRTIKKSGDNIVILKKIEGRVFQ